MTSPPDYLLLALRVPEVKKNKGVAIYGVNIYTADNRHKKKKDGVKHHGDGVVAVEEKLVLRLFLEKRRRRRRRSVRPFDRRGCLRHLAVAEK